MNLKENKKITLSLIEEFNPDNEYLTDDEDIQTRIKHIYNACMMSIARNKRIEKSYLFEEYKTSESDYYKEYDIPEDCYIIRDIVMQDKETKQIRNKQVDYYRMDKKLFINTKNKGQPILRYYAYPKQIEDNDKDDQYIFELDLDVQYLLPYAVASDILKIDKSADYTAFENKYRMELQALSPLKEEQRIFVSGGINI